LQEAERQLAALAREFNAHSAASAETKRRFADLTARKVLPNDLGERMT